MKRKGRAEGVSDILPEYDFSGGVRGKYAARYRERGNVVVLDVDILEKTDVWAPLVGFCWSGSTKQLADDTLIQPETAYRAYEEFTYELAEEERERCRAADHWLSIKHAQGDKLSAREKISSVLLALWIVRPTATQAPFRFEKTESGTKTIARVLERCQWIKGHTASEIHDHHLAAVETILPPLRAAYTARRRLRNALVLTRRGCVSRDWQSSFICFAAATEALLTYSRERGLVERLAQSYAKLVSRSPAAVKSAHERFRRLYNVRSDIIHGRAHDRKTPRRNLSDLAEFSTILRRLWRVVLKRPEWQVALEADDRQRERFFLSL